MHINFPDLFILTIPDEQYNPEASHWSILPLPPLLSPSSVQIQKFPSTPCSQTPSHCSTHMLRNPASHLYKTTGNITVLFLSFDF